MNTVKIPCETGEVSDGYHSFNELYDHRIALYAALLAANKETSWMSKRHHDGSEMTGWFIAGVKLESGDITYHLPDDEWELLELAGIPVLDRGIEWDGHTSEDVVLRLKLHVELTS